MIERRLWRNMDWGLLASAVLIGLIGVATIFSAAHRGPDPNLYLRQLAFLTVGTAGLVAVLLVDYRSLTDHGPLLYVGAVVVLLSIDPILTLWAGLPYPLFIGIARLFGRRPPRRRTRSQLRVRPCQPRA